MILLDKKKVGKAITYLRKRAGFTQKDLADRIGISDKAVSKWERGLGLPDIAYFGKLSILLDTDMDSLLAGDVIHHDMDWVGLMVLTENTDGINVGTSIYDKPMCYYLLSYFMLIGIKKIFVACRSDDESFMKMELGDGSKFGMSLIYCGYLKEDVRRLLNEEKEFSNLMVVYGRSFIYGVDQTRYFHKAMSHRDRITILSLPKKVEELEYGNSSKDMRTCKALVLNDKREVVESDNEDKIYTQYDYYHIPVFFCPRSDLFKLTADEETFKIDFNGFKEQRLFTEVLDRGYVEMPMEDVDQVLNVSSFVRLVQNACGMKIYCIEEIAWRRGLIDLERLKDFGEMKKQTAYGKYILSLYDRYSRIEQE